MDLAVRTLYREALGSLITPASCSHAPEALVHIHERMDALGLRACEGVRELLCAFPERQVYREAGVVSAAMPPMPEDA
jgi:hypothetical protein